MTASPFRADPTVARRIEELAARVGSAVEADVAALVARPPANRLGA